MPKHYMVSWEIDIDEAEDPRDAAEQAWAHMRRDDSIANVFTVEDTKSGEIEVVDLWLDEP